MNSSMKLFSLTVISTVLLLAACSKKPKTLVATMETNHGTVVMELFEDITPITVDNFTGLATGTKTWTALDGTKMNTPYYDGLTFHRVIKDFMIQGGCPQGTGTGGPGYKFQDETFAGKMVPLTGTIEDQDMANYVFNGLLIPYFKNTPKVDLNPTIDELIKTLYSKKSYEPMLGMTVEQLQELVGTTEPVTFFEKELTPITGEITDEAMADAVFQNVLVPHLREHDGESPIPEVKALYDEIIEANGPTPFLGKTVEEIKALVGIDAEVTQTTLLGKVEYGTLCMANSGPNTNGSQFFIVTNPAGSTHLNGKHTVFGKVIEGMEVVLAIQEVEKGASDKPVEDVTIISMTIDRI